MSPNAPAPRSAPLPVSSTTGRSASAHAIARVRSSTQKRARPPRARKGDASAESPSEPVNTSVGQGRVTTAGDTAVANSRPEIDSHPIAKSSAATTPPTGRRWMGASRAASERGGADGDAELMLLLQAVLLKLGRPVGGPDLDGRHGDFEGALVEIEKTRR